jgi:hypothetical protein
VDVKAYNVEDVLAALRRKIGDGCGDGSFAFHHAGKFLGMCLWRLAPDGVAPEEWHERLCRIRDDPDTGEAVAWFERELPRLIEPIPSKHRAVFVGAALEMVGVKPANPVRHESRNLTRRSRNRKRAERRKRLGQIDNTST